MQTLSSLRIHAVAELTGVPEPTLRAWERRYGVPSPRRTPSGYRLYGPADVEHIREMRRLCEEGGMATSDAAQQVLRQSPPTAPQADPYAAMAEVLVDAATRYDSAAVDDVLRRLHYLDGAGPVVDGVLAPALRAVGDRWHAGELDVGQEHFLSQRVGSFLRVRALTQLVDGDAKDCAVLACATEEEHELGLLATAVRMPGWGIRPLFLGARTPPSAVRDAVRKTDACLVALSVTVAPPRSRARALLGDYAAACGKVPLLVGGSGAHAIADAIRDAGGILAPEDPARLRAIVRRASQRPRRKS